MRRKSKLRRKRKELYGIDMKVHGKEKLIWSDQDLFLKWEETVETVERRTKTITKTIEENDGNKTVNKTVEVRLDKIETKIYKKI